MQALNADREQQENTNNYEECLSCQ
jgi:hypothetical protein